MEEFFPRKLSLHIGFLLCIITFSIGELAGKKSAWSCLLAGVRRGLGICFGMVFLGVLWASLHYTRIFESCRYGRFSGFLDFGGFGHAKRRTENRPPLSVASYQPAGVQGSSPLVPFAAGFDRGQGGTEIITSNNHSDCLALL